jgi:hypothetical protein
MGRSMIPFLHRYALAVACVAAPFLFGLWPGSLTVAWLMAPSHVERMQLDYRLRDQPAPAPQGGAAEKSERGEASPAAAKGDAKPDAAARFELVAQHFSGLVNFALTSGFLYLVWAAAFAVSGIIIQRWLGGRMLALVVAAFAVVAALETWLVMVDKQRRILVTDNIWQLVDRHDLLRHMPIADQMVELLAFNIFLGLFTAGVVLMALSVASVRCGPSVDRTNLEERLFVIRATMIMSSALLVVVVLQTKALVEWPISLLVEAQRRALDPGGDAITRLWAGSSSAAMLAAFLPGITAWYLDRRDYRAAHAGVEAQPPADGLDIAPLSTVTAILAVLAPVVASPILDAAKSLVSVVGGK